jgi:hypothetical protein
VSRRAPGSRTTGTLESATRRAVMTRDAGLRRVSAITRWSVAGAAVLSGALALIASKAFDGHTVTTTPASTANSPAADPPSASSSQLTPTPPLGQPSQGPAAAAQTPAVVSGGS